MASELLCPIGSDAPTGFCKLPADVFASFAVLVDTPDKGDFVVITRNIDMLRRAIDDDAQATKKAIDSILESHVSCTGDVVEMRRNADYESKTMEQKCLQDLLVLAGCLRYLPRVAGAVGRLGDIQESLRGALSFLDDIAVGAAELTRTTQNTAARDELLTNIDHVQVYLRSMLEGGQVEKAKDYLVSSSGFKKDSTRPQRMQGYGKLLEYAARQKQKSQTNVSRRLDVVKTQVETSPTLAAYDSYWAEQEGASAPYVAPYIPALAAPADAAGPSNHGTGYDSPAPAQLSQVHTAPYVASYIPALAAASASKAGPSIYGTGYDAPVSAQYPQARSGPMLARFRGAQSDASASAAPRTHAVDDGLSVASSQSQYSGLTGLTTRDVAQQPVYQHSFADSANAMRAYLSRTGK